MTTTYQAALALSKTRKRKLANNTYLTTDKAPDSFGVRLHDTEILTYHSDGRVSMDTGGWMTITTKARLNEFLDGWMIYQDKGVWYLSSNNGTGWASDNSTHPFADGITIHPDGTVTGQGEDPKAQAKLRKRAKLFAKQYVEAFYAGEVPKPGPGDCFICMVEGRHGDTSHLLSHIDESYFVPRLLHNALTRFPASQAVRQAVYETWETGEPSKWLSVFSLKSNGGNGSNIIAQGIEKSLRRFMYEQLGSAS